MGGHECSMAGPENSPRHRDNVVVPLESSRGAGCSIDCSVGRYSAEVDAQLVVVVVAVVVAIVTAEVVAV